MSATATLDWFARIYAAWIALAVVVPLPRQLAWVRRRGGARETPQLLGRWPVPRIGRAATTLLAGALVASLLVVMSGASAMGAAAVLAGGVAVFFFAQVIELPEVRRKPGTVPLILGVAGTALLVPIAAREPVAVSALLTIKVIVALVYFSSGLVKLRNVGWAWGTSDTLQMTLLRYHLRNAAAAPLWLARRPAWCRVGASSVLVFELTFWLLIPFPALAWIYLPAGIAFHAGTAVLMRIHYWIYLVPAYWVFVRC
ncbi:MAG: hypothetical protein RLZZ15_2140 [Verrucomicrobiota bacterium]|jgi:hypothetical protein